MFFDCETSYRCVFVRSIPISSTRPEDELVKPNNSPDPHPPKSSCRAQLWTWSALVNWSWSSDIVVNVIWDNIRPNVGRLMRFLASMLRSQRRKHGRLHLWHIDSLWRSAWLTTWENKAQRVVHVWNSKPIGDRFQRCNFTNCMSFGVPNAQRCKRNKKQLLSNIIAFSAHALCWLGLKSAVRMGLLALRQAALLHEHGWVRPAIFGFRPSHVGFPGIASASRAPKEKHQVQNCGPTQFCSEISKAKLRMVHNFKEIMVSSLFPYCFFHLSYMSEWHPFSVWGQRCCDSCSSRRMACLRLTGKRIWTGLDSCPENNQILFLNRARKFHASSFHFLRSWIATACLLVSWQLAFGKWLKDQELVDKMVLPQLFDLRTPLGRLLSHEGKYMQMQMLPMNSTLPNVATKWSCFKLLLKLGPVSHGAATPVKDTGSWASSAFRRMWH